MYRLHPLIPDDRNWFSQASGEHLRNTDFTEIQGKYTRDFTHSIEMGDLWYSMGQVR